MKKAIFFSFIPLLISINSMAIVPSNTINNNTNLLLKLEVTQKATCAGQQPPPPSDPYIIKANQSSILFIGTDDPQFATICLPRVTSLKASAMGVSPATIQNSDGIAIKDYTVSVKNRNLVIE